MYKKIYNSLDERFYMEQSELTFREVSSGVFIVEKDRHKNQIQKYVTHQLVISELNDELKVLVIGISGTYTNFDAKGK